MAPRSKALVKPSQQTQFVLDVMAEASSSVEKRLERVQESVDLLFTKMEAQEAAQHQMAMQVDLTSQAIAQANQEHQALAQQLATTTEVVT
jgi:septation ring formation regulator EzrA